MAAKTTTMLGRAVHLAAALMMLTLLATKLPAQTGEGVQPGQVGGSGGTGVDDYTGAFYYSVPLLTVPGPSGTSFPIVLNYKSGAPPDAGVSWVGYGWDLNPGSVVRSTRGLPDDFKGRVTYYNRVKDNWTVTSKATLNLKLMSQDLLDSLSFPPPMSLGLDYFIRYNNYLGYNKLFSVGATAKGLGTLKYAVDEGGGHWEGVPGTDLLSVFAHNLTHAMNLDYSSAEGEVQRIVYSLAPVAFTNPAYAHVVTPPYPAPSPRYTGSSSNYRYNFALSLPPYLFGLAGGEAGNYTRQSSIPVTTMDAMGYLYSGDALPNAVTDYYEEKSSSVYKDNPLLPIPFSSPDEFVATGTAFAGSFHLVSTNSGHFFPSLGGGYLGISQYSVLGHAAGRFGVGFDGGCGGSQLTIEGWRPVNPSDAYRFKSGAGPRECFFRMDGDMGGSIAFSSSDAPERADIISADEADSSVPAPRIPISIYSTANQGTSVGRNVYIAYSTNGDMTAVSAPGSYYKSYSKDAVNRALVDRTKDAIKNQIGEIAVMGASGNRVVYGLPVYSRNERKISHILTGIGLNAPGSIAANFLAYKQCTIDDGSPYYVGTAQDQPYATTYLVTEITSPDFVDIDNNGPSIKDLGGYVQFTYRRAAGSYDKSASSSSAPWYSWRTPYRGLMYARGESSDPDDDIGSYSSGEREIYYPKTIETKTHIAVFVTNKTNITIGGKAFQGSGATRQDGFQALSAAYEATSAGDSTASTASTGATNLVERLERIELYTKGPNGFPDSLQATVFLEYDYSLRGNMPNSMKGFPDTTKRQGILTLKKVWTRNQGIANARISPMNFGYQYPTASSYPQHIRSLYPEIVHYADSLSTSEQNPDYSPFDVDPWGSYQYAGKTRYQELKVGVNQTPDTTRFDPAAWQLKTIRVPSGGETQIQYEQADYSFVQDRPACALVSLNRAPGSGYASLDDDSHAQYYLNLADIGVPDSSYSRVRAIRDAITDEYLARNNKIFFRLLYALNGDSANFGRPEYNSEYITGYGDVHEVRLDTVATSPYRRYAVIIDIHGDGDVSVPKRICNDFVKKRRRGRLGPDEGLADEGGGHERVLRLLGLGGTVEYHPADHCKDLDYAHSYVRIPLVAPKKGGGIRVKRLLTLDPGVEGDTALYGTEYIYRAYDESRRDTISTGVASNEPGALREENPLVAAWPSDYPSYAMSELIYGRFEDQYEGPIGESLLPAARIGYSKVITKNIYSGRTNPGFGIRTFFTSRDYPTLRVIPDIGPTFYFTPADIRYAEHNRLSLGIFNSIVDNVNISQGYRFILGDMEGKPRLAQTYGGVFSNKETWSLSSSAEYSYFQPGEKIPVADKIGDSITYENMGKEMEVVFAGKSVSDITNDGWIEGDVSMGWGLVDLQGSGFGGTNYTENILRTHVTTKISRYPAVLKSVMSYADGVYNYVENVAFDRQTGAPLITRTSDGFDRLALPGDTNGHKGLYHAFSIPAYRQYKAMGPKAYNDRLVLKDNAGTRFSKVGSSGNYKLVATGYDGGTCAIFDAITPGDILELRAPGTTTYRGLYYATAVKGDTVTLAAVPASVGTSESTTGYVDAEVIRSGRTNQLTIPAGDLTTYGHTAQEVASGAYLTKVEPSGFTARKQFANLLNTRVSQGGGFITPHELDSIGISLVIGLDDSCRTVQDTIRVTRNATSVILTVGRFKINHVISGDSASPHPMVAHLNAYLDSLWGYRIDTSLVHTSQCDSASYYYRSYNSTPSDYLALKSRMFDRKFAYINNHQDSVPLSDLIARGADDQFQRAFKLDTGRYLRASGQMAFYGKLVSDSITAMLWMWDCTTNHIMKFENRLKRSGVYAPSSWSLAGPKLYEVLNFFPYTSQIGRFEEDANGYLKYRNLYDGTLPDSNIARKIFDIRFHRYDTTIMSLTCETSFEENLFGGGSFDVADDGTLVYSGPSTLPCGPTSVRCVRFCPVPNLYRKRQISNVIAASAAVFDDRNPYVESDYRMIDTTASDSYIGGKRGKWRPRTGYAYRTGIVTGGKHGTTDRNYRNAGVYNDFTLFDWAHPGANDTTAWLRGDTVLACAPDGTPLTVMDPIGVKSATRLGNYTAPLPVISGVNADHEALAFTSIEDDTTLTGPVKGIAHTGNWSIQIPENSGMFSRLYNLKLSQQILDSGLAIRFWAKNLYDTSKFKVGKLGGPYGQLTRIARTGDWSLYEAVIRDFDGMTAGMYYYTYLRNQHTTSDTVWVDDIKAQPVNAMASCIAYDARTLRPLAMFDAQHFPTYYQYNAEGKAVRMIAETDRGIKTVLESHANMPSTVRSSGVGLPGLPVIGSRKLRDRYEREAARTSEKLRATGEDEPAAAQANADLVDVQLDPTRQTVSVLGGAPERIQDLPSALAGKLRELGSAVFSAKEKVDRLADIMRVEHEIDSLRAGINADPTEQAQLRSEELLRQRKVMLDELGISEDDLNGLRDEIRAYEDAGAESEEGQ